MEFSFLIVFVLYLSGSANCFQLTPTLSVKTPVDFELEINGNLFNNDPNIDVANLSKTSGSVKQLVNQCFCLPSDPRNELVTNFLGPKDQKLERLVVYLYRIDGILQVFIPNKQTQQEIPDLTFDLQGGDVLKPLSYNTVAEIFEDNPSILTEWQPQVSHFEAKVGGEEKDVNAGLDTQQTSDVNDKTFVEAENDIMKSIAEDQRQTETSETKPTDEISFDNVLPFNEQEKPIIDLPVTLVQEPLFINPELENINVNKNFNKIPSHVPKNQAQFSLPQMQNPIYNILQDKNPKFNDWFNNQLSYVVLDNSGKQPNAAELRKNIQDVLKNNGMFVSNAGYLYDSAGNILNMSNLKLRTILIGDPVETHTHQIGNFNLAPTQISYMQMILVVSSDPPEILGVVPSGKLFLPRKVNTQNVGSLKNQYEGKKHFLRLSPQLGCINCNSRRQHDTQQTDDIPTNDIPYFELPLRRGFDSNIDQIAVMRSFYETPSDVPVQPERRTSSESNNNDLSGMLQSLLGFFGPTNLFGEQTRRLLGGKIFRKEKPTSKSHMHDTLPDYRIIGGKPATSSGVPIVSKGRSGFHSRL